jgi:hypothetical protein
MDGPRVGARAGNAAPSGWAAPALIIAAVLAAAAPAVALGFPYRP